MAATLTDKHLASPRRRATLVLLLLGLTGLSFAVGTSELMGHPWTGRSLLVVISLAKAALVVLFFMHLWWETSWKYAIALPVLLLAAVLTLALFPDVGSRQERYSSSRSRLIPSPAAANESLTEIN